MKMPHLRQRTTSSTSLNFRDTQNGKTVRLLLTLERIWKVMRNEVYIMKKLLSIIIAFTLLFSVAYADGLSDFIENWNKAAYIYAAPELSYNDVNVDGDLLTLSDNNWNITLEKSWDGIKKATLSTSDNHTFLQMSVMLGIAIVRDNTIDQHFNFEANVLERYLRLESKPLKSAAFGPTHIYTIEKDDDKYIFVLEEI